MSISLEKGYNSINASDGEVWEYAGSGGTKNYNNIFETEREYDPTIDPEAQFLAEKEQHEKKKLGQFRATAIAGNDITCMFKKKKTTLHV